MLANSIITPQRASHYCRLTAAEKRKDWPASLHLALEGEEGRGASSLLASPTTPFLGVQPGD